MDLGRLFSGLLLLLSLAVLAGLVFKPETMDAATTARVADRPAAPDPPASQVESAAEEGETPQPDFAWPPQLGVPYPDAPLHDTEGNPASLARYRGKMVLVELVGMTCPACNAFAGGHERGGFAGVRPQPDLQSMDSYIRQIAGVSPDHPELAVVQLLLYGEKDTPGASPDEGKRWSRHFGLDAKPGHDVLVGDARQGSLAGRAGIPGFYLLDRQGVVVAKSGKTGTELYDEVLPMLGRSL